MYSKASWPESQTRNFVVKVKGLPLYHAIPTLYKNPCENIVGRGENTGNQHFLLFPQCFLPFPKQISIFRSHFFFVVCKCFQFGKILFFDKELRKKMFPAGRCSMYC